MLPEMASISQAAEPPERRRVSPFHEGQGHDDGSGSPGFRTILFPPGLENLRARRCEQPPCLADLHLDQVLAEILAERDETGLRPIFYATYREEEVIRYRQAVFADLERQDILRPLQAFGEAMRCVRTNLAYAGKTSCDCHRNLIFLQAVHLYCEAVRSLCQSLEALPLGSLGLKNLRQYLLSHTSSHAFVQLATETAELRKTFSELTYGMIFRGDRVIVRKYASEPDYAVAVLERFARFRETEIAPRAARPGNEADSTLNHIEEAILEFVGRLFPAEFRALRDFVALYPIFMDEVISAFDHEIGFFIAYLGFIAPIRQTGLTFCYPEVSAASKDIEVSESFDLALAAKLTAEKRSVVCNDFFLRAPERLIIITGPNQGGKTTFTRMFGQLHFLAGLGCPVPGRHARLFLADRIFTHFEREETIANLRGKLEDELVRLHQTLQAMTANSVVVLNEIFNSTSLDDQVFLSTEVLQRILAMDSVGVCVTFIDALSSLNEKTVSMASTVMPDDPERRTLKLVRKPADGLAYALSLAEKRGVTYKRLLARVRP